MKRIVNGVTYNTDTATLLAQSKWEEDGEHAVGTLYQTLGGAFFVNEEITKTIWNEGEREHQKQTTNNFVPLSPEGAHKWLMEGGDVEVFRNPFEDPPEATAEAEPAATIYIRVPASLKRFVDEAAKSEKLSGNVWAMRCVERCLNPNPYPDAKKALATAYAILVRIGAQDGDGLSLTQVACLLGEVKEKIEEAWCGLDFDDEPNPSDLYTNIVQNADQSELERLQIEYSPFNLVFLTKVDQLDLSVRSSSCLRNDNIVYIGDLVQKSMAEMLRTPNFGRKSLNEINEVLAQMGLHLGMEVPGWPPKNIEALAKRFEDMRGYDFLIPPVHDIKSAAPILPVLGIRRRRIS
jgi:hypothetical protein